MHERELFCHCEYVGLGICIDAAMASPLCPVNYSIWPVWQEETKINRGGLQHNVVILFLLSFFPSVWKKSALATDTHPRFFGAVVRLMSVLVIAGVLLGCIFRTCNTICTGTRITGTPRGRAGSSPIRPMYRFGAGVDWGGAVIFLLIGHHFLFFLAKPMLY